MSWSESLQRARYARETCSWDVCQQWLEQAFEESLELDPNRRAATLNNLGLLYRRERDFEQAQACYEQASVLAQDEGLKGRILANRAVLEHRAGRLSEARRLYTEALQLGAEHDPLGVARSCVNFAWLHLQQERAVQAESLLKRARSLCQELSDELLQSRLHLAMARLAVLQKRLSKAEMEVLQGIRGIQRCNYFDPLLQGQSRAALAQVYSLQGGELLIQVDTRADGESKIQQADQMFAEALSVLEDWGEGLSFEYVDALSLQADHCMRTQRWEEADGCCRRCLEILTAGPEVDKTLLSLAWERAATVLRQLGQHEMAQAALTQARA